MKERPARVSQLRLLLPLLLLLLRDSSLFPLLGSLLNCPVPPSVLEGRTKGVLELALFFPGLG